jgi:hypothetical protein
VSLIQGRLAAVSVRAAIGAGAWVGFALGLVAGALVGALLAWFAGAVLGWQRELGLTLGVTHALLPFGDQIPALRWISGHWWVVVPAAALIVGLLVAIVGALIGGLLAAAYNRSPRHANVVVELDDAARSRITAEAGAGPRRRRRSGGTRVAREGGPAGSPRTR